MNEQIDNFSIFPELNNEISEEKEEYLKYSEIFLKNIKNENKENNNITISNNNYLLNILLNFQKNKKIQNKELIDSIILFLENSDLINKIKSHIYNKYISNENENNIQIKINKLLKSLSYNLNFKQIEKGDFLLKLNELSNKCYFLIEGKISILKPIKLLNIELTYEQYLQYLCELDNENEKILIEKILIINYKNFPIQNYNDLKNILKIYFKYSIFNSFLENKFSEFIEIKKFFKKYFQKFFDY